MNVVELKKQLRLFPTVISILGKESVFVEEAINAILDVFAKDKDMREFNVESVQGKLTKEARASIAEEPVSSDFRVVFLYSEEPDKFLQVKPQTTVLVSVDKPFSSSQLEIDCKKLYGKQLRAWARNEGKRNGIKLDTDDVETLIEECGGSLRKLRGDIFKLSMFGSSFGADVVKQVAYSSLGNSGWDILKLIQAGNVSEAANALQRAKASGTSILQILAALQKQYIALGLLKSNAKPNGVPEFELERLEKAKQRYTTKAIREILTALLAVELKAKSGSMGLDDLRLIANLSRLSS